MYWQRIMNLAFPDSLLPKDEELRAADRNGNGKWDLDKGIVAFSEL